MFVIITYDIDEKRVAKVHKKLKKYLVWTQRSVFEGEITISKLNKCLYELENIMDKTVDSVYIYKVEYQKNIDKKVLGKDLCVHDFFL